MLAEMLLGTAFVAGTGVLSWLWNVHSGDVRRNKEEEARRQRIASDRRREEMNRIGKLIYLELRANGVASFRPDQFTVKHDLPPEDLAEASRKLYSGMVEQMVSDGVITPKERTQLDGVARALQIDKVSVDLIETEAKAARFRAAMHQATADGALTAGELADLDSLRSNLGMRREDASEIIGAEGKDAYFAVIERAVDSLKIDGQQKASLASMRQAIFPHGVMPHDCLDRANSLFRKATTLILADGIVEDFERVFLEWLRVELSPSQRDVNECTGQIERVTKLAEYRSGRLPSIRASVYLESGELCHYEGRGSYFVDSKRGYVRHEGALIISSRKIRFLSPTKTLTIAPMRIMDVTISGKSLHLALDVRPGQAILQISEPEVVEAILVGVARKSKYTADYTSAQSRQIPAHVKSEVWARDGGRCVECNIDHALQFDHIIPHSKGGATTVKNLQLLCSPCNLKKSDRI
jgi:hypothetical protein